MSHPRISSAYISLHNLNFQQLTCYYGSLLLDMGNFKLSNKTKTLQTIGVVLTFDHLTW